MKRLLSLLLMLVVLLGGCRSTPSREEVFVLDISQSIDADAEQQMFVAVEDVAQHLQRGDTLTIIPITGNAVAELQGRTLRYSVPTADNRRAYDADIRNLNARIKDDFAHLQADAIAHPGKQTDILGSIQTAMREFSNQATNKQLVILSDFIQDDQQYNFDRDLRLKNVASAIAFAHVVSCQINRGHVAQIFLGRLRSNEFISLPVNRQHAINSFWETLLDPAVIRPDGLRELQNRL